MVITLLLLTLLSVYTLGWSKIIVVKSIKFSGLAEPAEISQVRSQLVSNGSDLQIGTQLARLLLSKEEKIITELKWIEKAKLSRDWWRQEVTVVINPRRAVAIFEDTEGVKASNQVENAPRYLSSDGIEFASPIKFENLSTIKLKDKSRAKRSEIARFVAALGPEILALVGELEISESGEILMISEDKFKKVEINWGKGNSTGDISVKGKVLAALLALKANKNIRYIDLRNVSSPIVR